MSARAFAPGRVNLIGEHTDYNGGLALPFAIGLGVTATVRVGGGSGGPEPPLVGAIRSELGHGLPPVTISSDLPAGIGLGSSGALGVAVTLALGAHAGSLGLHRRDVAATCLRAEHSLGARTGLLDQLASLYGEPGRALLIDFSADDPVLTPVPLELGGCRLVVVDSGSPRVNASSGYNERRAECERRVPSRLRHVESENERVRAAVDAVQVGDMDALGRLLDASHASLRDDYEVSTPEVEAVVRALRAAGALGARIHGGGFGGGVLALLPAGVYAPPGALIVTPSAGARLLAGGSATT